MSLKPEYRNQYRTPAAPPVSFRFGSAAPPAPGGGFTFGAPSSPPAFGFGAPNPGQFLPGRTGGGFNAGGFGDRSVTNSGQRPPPTSFPPHHHSLSPLTDGSRRTCDVCQYSPPPNVTVRFMTCRRCDYDECEDCFGARNPTAAVPDETIDINSL